MITIGTYRVKNEGRWIGESLERTLQVADRCIVLDNESADDTCVIARSFGPRVTVIEQPPGTSFNEANDKTILLKAAVQEKADWVFCLDGDEVLTLGAVNEAREIFYIGAPGIYFFRIAYLWDHPEQERCDSLYNEILAPRLFSMFDQKLSPISYRTTDHTGNMHCGSLPNDYKGRRRDALAVIKHYGYLFAADRERKHAWYNASDTAVGRAREGNYDHIIGKPSPHAPGPVLFRPFVDK